MAAVCGLIALAVPGGAAPGSQAVQASEGSYAKGMVGPISFADGSRRVFSALYVIPKGLVAGSPAAVGADLAKPWVSFDISVHRGDVSSVACSLLVNPASWRDASESPDRTVGGMQFTASCPNDPLYSAYTVSFDSAIFDGRPSGVYQYSRPQPTYETFSAEAPLAANGTLEASVVSVESATMTVCGRRHDGARDCHSLAGGAKIYPSLQNVVAKGYRAG